MAWRSTAVEKTNLTFSSWSLISKSFGLRCFIPCIVRCCGVVPLFFFLLSIPYDDRLSSPLLLHFRDRGSISWYIQNTTIVRWDWDSFTDESLSRLHQSSRWQHGQRLPACWTHNPDRIPAWNQNLLTLSWNTRGSPAFGLSCLGRGSAPCFLLFSVSFSLSRLFVFRSEILICKFERFINHELERIVTGASTGIIALSHDSLIDRWRVGRIEIQPQVWLAVFSTIINALLAFSLTLGVSINFWKRAGRGTTVSQIFLFNLSYKLFWMNLTSIRERSCENCTIFMNRRLFWALRKRFYRTVGTWFLLVSERHSLYHCEMSSGDFIENSSLISKQAIALTWRFSQSRQPVL